MDEWMDQEGRKAKEVKDSLHQEINYIFCSTGIEGEREREFGRKKLSIHESNQENNYYFLNSQSYNVKKQSQKKKKSLSAQPST